MGLIVDMKKAESVGELIAALQKFPPGMPLRCGFDERVVIYRDKPTAGEIRDDKRGCVVIDGDDGTYE